MENNKKRAVCYCRVSTDKEEQRTSIKNQRIILTDLCNRNGWEIPSITVKNICNKGVYYDEGESGTKLSRPSFDRLLLDAGLTPIVDADTDKKTTAYKIDKEAKFNYIVVKDPSRFARNVSVNEILQKLKDNNVFVYFSDLQMSTETNEHWSIIQQYLIFSENESRRRSTAVSKAYEAGARTGKIYYGGHMLGYDYDKNNNALIINEKEAELIRTIFDLYVNEGYGQQVICQKLAEKGFYTKNKKGEKTIFGRSTIARVLRNSKYCGISNIGRYYKADLFSSRKKERDYNDPIRVAARKAQKEQEKQDIVKIPAIITKDTFIKAQEITAHNSEIYRVSKERHSSTDYSKKIVCGCCGAYYRASGRRLYTKYGEYTVPNSTDEKVSKDGIKGKVSRYTCKHTVEYDTENGISKCTNPSILEPELDKVLFGKEYWIQKRISLENIIDNGNHYIKVLEAHIDTDNIEAVKELEQKIIEVTEKRERYLDLYGEGQFDKTELLKRTEACEDTISELQSRKEHLSKGNESIKDDISIITKLVKSAKKELKEAEQILESKKQTKKTRRELLRDVEKIVIDDKGKPHIYFKSIETISTANITIGKSVEAYNDADEIGWEEELAEAEAWAESVELMQE